MNCVVSSCKWRAWGCIIVPFAAVAIGIGLLSRNQLSPLLYFHYLNNGSVSWARQGVAWTALIFWIVKTYPVAYSNLKHRCLVYFSEDGTIIVCGQQMNIRSFDNFEIERGIFKRMLVGVSGRQRHPFCALNLNVEEDGEILDRLRRAVGESKAALV